MLRHGARRYTTSTSTKSKPIISIPAGSNIYPFGAPAQSKTPLISNLAWTVHEGEAWAVVSGTGGAGKSAIFKASRWTLLGHTRLAPPRHEIQARWAEEGGLYPFLSQPISTSKSSPSNSTPIDPYTRISFVSFRQRSASGGDAGAFFDYTARYGAMREEEDKRTLRDVLSDAWARARSAQRAEDAADEAEEPSKQKARDEEIEKEKEKEREKQLTDLISQIGLTPLLDLPLITLSNGQTRRARIVSAILGAPELMILDEPLTGLDPPSRLALSNTLNHLHRSRAPRVLLGLRKGEEVPAWVTHVLEVDGAVGVEGGGSARVRTREEEVAADGDREGEGGRSVQVPSTFPARKDQEVRVVEEHEHHPGALLVDMQNVNVAYGERKILKDINWQIRQGERWHLQGANGSGKTTLLALLTGDHPQSYTQQHLLLPSFSSSNSSNTSASTSTSTSSSTSPSPSNAQTTTTPPQPLQHRKRLPTAHLRRVIGVVSPEMFDAFPRRHPGMSVWEAVGTGFDGGFVPRSKGAPGAHASGGAKVERQGAVGWIDVDDDELGVRWDATEEVKERRREEVRAWRVMRCWEVLEALGPASWASSTSSTHTSPLKPTAQTLAFASTPFSALPPGTQRLVLLMRALVARPPIVLLDEAWSGMSAEQIEAARAYLRGAGVGADQAVVVITHWEGEVPWDWERGEVKRFNLSER